MSSMDMREIEGTKSSAYGKGKSGHVLGILQKHKSPPEMKVSKF